MQEPPASLKILIANIAMIRRTGTQMFVRDLCLGLQKSGHKPMIYSPQLGEIAAEIAASGIPVVNDFSKLPAEPVIIHSNQHSEGLEAFLHFPNVWHISVCHGATSHFNIPLLMPYMGHYVAVDDFCYERLHHTYKIPEHRIRVIYNAVDTDRFQLRDPLPKRPRRALVFSNYAGEYPYLEAVKTACQQLDIELDVVGEGVGNLVTHPEKLLGEYDLVFGKARAALEAMAVGCAVVLCDFAGVGKMVTSNNVSEFRRWNFGRKLLTGSHKPDLIVNQIRRYNADDARKVSKYVRVNATLKAAVEQYIQLYQGVLSQPFPDVSGTEQFRAYVDTMLKLIVDYESANWKSLLPGDVSQGRRKAGARLHLLLAPFRNSDLYRRMIRPIRLRVSKKTDAW